MSTYEEFQQQPSSEKIVLAKVKASNRLMGWVLHSGSIYKIEDFDFELIESVEDSGTGLAEESGLSSVMPGTFYNDRENKILYLETSDSANPNGKYIVVTFQNFFSNVPVQAAHSISSGFDVFWMPLIKQTSGFGVELDNDDQIGFALEGSGSISLINDPEYWQPRYELYTWDNQDVEVYSWSRSLDISEAKIVYKGIVNSKRFGPQRINFSFKDQLKQLRASYPLTDLSELSGAILPEALQVAKQRRIYGRPNGFRPTNIDQVVEGYTLPGTVSLSAGSDTLTGVGTSFKTHFSPDDRIKFGEEEFTVQSISSDVSMVLTEESEGDFVTVTYEIVPEFNKNFVNREWLVAGHECSQPSSTITNADSQNRVTLSNTIGLKEGQDLFFGDPGTGEAAKISKLLSNNKVILQVNLEIPPLVGTAVVRPAVQDLKINNTKLIYDRDYTVSSTGGLTKVLLKKDCEKNIAPIRRLNGSVTFTTSSSTVTGSGTQFTSQLIPGQHVRPVGEVEFFQILSIESDISLTLVEDATYTATAAGQYKPTNNFDIENDVLSCSVNGTTDDNTAQGNPLITCGEIVKDILTKSNIGNLNAASYDNADIEADYELGFAIPKVFSSSSVPKVRDVINWVNASVFGSFVQNEDLELEYNILKPSRPASALTLRKNDVLKINIESNNERIIKTAIVAYDCREYDPTTFEQSIKTRSKTSQAGLYLTKVDETRTITTVLTDSNAAKIQANRWSFLLELSTNIIKIETKMQGSRLKVNDIVKIDHEKLYNRLGGGMVRYGAVQSINKTEKGAKLELDDLSNAFNRVCVISDDATPDFDNSSLEQKVERGYITDTNGLINNGNFGLNLIW